MLIDKINNCTSCIDELSLLRSNALMINAFETSVGKLASVDSTVTNYVSTVEEMDKHDFCKIAISKENIEKMQDAIRTCAAAVNSLSLNSNDVSAITTVFQSEEAMLTTFWNATAKAYVTPICSYLGIIQTFSANKDEIANLSNALNNGASAKPDASVVKTLSKNIAKANTITSNFQMSNDVRAFLGKVKTGKATFADITQDVSNWINDHDLGTKIKLTF